MNHDRRDPYSGVYDPTRANYPRSETGGAFVGILRRTVHDRGLRLIKERARCIRQGEIHEFIITEEPGAIAGQEVDSIAYLGFAEFSRGGVILCGDIFSVDGQEIGELAGVDETHMPNHMNIVIRGKGLVSGYDRGFMLGSRFTFKSPYPDERLTAASPQTSRAGAQ